MSDTDAAPVADFPMPAPQVRFVLASASPARHATLQRAGVCFEVIVSNFDESAIQADSPAALARKLAELKAATVARRLSGQALVLGCDSVLELDGVALGKPGSDAVAIARWRQMRGRSGVLHTGHCLVDVGSQQALVQTVSTTVHFADITDEEIEVYCTSGEPANVAGAFTIDGFGGWFIDGVEGDPHNVVGVSLPVLRRMLRQFGYGLHDLGYPMP